MIISMFQGTEMFTPKIDDDHGNLRLCYQLQVNVGALKPGQKKFDQQLTEEDEVSNGRNAKASLWQVFFASPEEWWDNRKEKRAARAPDFKHKNTGEALWLYHNDPPWVKRQLELLA